MLFTEKMQILSKFSDFLDVFLKAKTLMLLKATVLNQYTLELQKSQQSLYGSIYSLDSIDIKMLKTYFKTNLANNFI